MKTLAEVKQVGDSDAFQFLATKLDNWDITAHVDTSNIDRKEIKEKLVKGESVFVTVELKDEVIEKALVKLGGIARQNYVMTVYGIPESFRFP